MNPTERPRPTWDAYGMLLAYAASLRSPDPYVQVGAACFREDRSTIATGYNGGAPGDEVDWSDRELRRPHVVHAELNCLRYAETGEPYYLYVTLAPCKDCFENIRLAGVQEIFYAEIYKRDTFAIDNAAQYGIVAHQLNIPYEHLRHTNN